MLSNFKFIIFLNGFGTFIFFKSGCLNYNYLGLQIEKALNALNYIV